MIIIVIVINVIIIITFCNSEWLIREEFLFKTVLFFPTRLCDSFAWHRVWGWDTLPSAAELLTMQLSSLNEHLKERRR